MERITLNNRYQIINKIGGGGMAEVFHGYDTLLNRDVAIKILRDQYVEDKDFIEKFKQEACSAAKLLHPNIVNIYDVGRENNFYYIVMEHVAGPTLKEYILEKGHLSPKEALHIARGIASGLVQAHIHNVVHCDIKSHNILIDNAGTVKITDFGIAKITTENVSEKQDEVMGSVYYLSPEQACGGKVTPQSDLYSLGVVLFEMLTGRLPFEADSPMEVALQHVKDTIPSLQAIDPSMPLVLDKIISKSLAKKPEFRYKSAQEFLVDTKHAQELLNSTEDNKQEDTVKFTSLEVPIPEVGVNEETMVINKEDMLDQIHNYNVSKEKLVNSTRKKLSLKSILCFIASIVVLAVGGYALNEFSKPNVVVPDLTGKTIVEAEDILMSLKLTYALAEEYNMDVTSGQVCRQVPGPNTTVKEGRKIRLIISKGIETGVAPFLKGKTITEAREILKAAKIEVGDVKVRYAKGEKPNVVLEQSIAPKQKIQGTSKIDLVVNISEKQTAMPNIVGKTAEEAKSILSAESLKLGTIGKIESKQTADTIVEASSSIGTILDKGSSISVKIAMPQKVKEKPGNTTKIVEFVVPGNNVKKDVKIIVINDLGTSTIYSGVVNGGSHLRQQVAIAGSTKVQLIVDAKLIEEKIL